MMGMLLYVALGLMILTVLSNRFWRRQLATTRVSLVKLKEKADEVGRELNDAAHDYTTVRQKVADTEKRAARAEQELAAMLNDLEARKAGPGRRYYVFDRLEPRPGRFYEVAVRYDPNAASEERSIHRAWSGVRRYMLVAESEGEARERASGRFQRKLGFEVVEVAPCRLDGLAVNRIAELSTFRRPDPGEDGTAKRRNRHRETQAR